MAGYWEYNPYASGKFVVSQGPHTTRGSVKNALDLVGKDNNVTVYQTLNATSDCYVTKDESGGSGKHFYVATRTIDNVTYSALVVNKTFDIGADYDPGDRNEFLDAFSTMQSASGNAFTPTGTTNGFRTYARQEKLYNDYLKKDTQEEVDSYSARPGHSEHESGLAVDVKSTKAGESGTDLDKSFGNTSAGIWLAEHCWEYGFILRYPKNKQNITGYIYEPWHVRYVGLPLSQKIKESGTLEEFFGMGAVNSYTTPAQKEVTIDGKKMVSVFDGVVTLTANFAQNITSPLTTDRTREWGLGCIVSTNDNSQGFVYGHFCERYVEKGDKVSRGSIIGREGNYGYSSGSHCHFGYITNGAYTDITRVYPEGITFQEGVTYTFTPITGTGTITTNPTLTPESLEGYLKSSGHRWYSSLDEVAEDYNQHTMEYISLIKLQELGYVQEFDGTFRVNSSQFKPYVAWYNALKQHNIIVE